MVAVWDKIFLMDHLYLKYVYLDGLYYCIRFMGDARTENLICLCCLLHASFHNDPLQYCKGDVNAKLMLPVHKEFQVLENFQSVFLFCCLEQAYGVVVYSLDVEFLFECSCWANLWKGPHLKSFKHPSCLFHSSRDQYGWTDRGKSSFLSSYFGYYLLILPISCTPFN